MTAEECIEYCEAVSSIKYPDRYDVNERVSLSNKDLTTLPIPFAFQPSIAWGVVTEYFVCSDNNLTSLYNAPIEVGRYFDCSYNQLTTLDHLPKYIGGDLWCLNNPFQNLNAFKDVEIKYSIRFYYDTEKNLDYWVQALYNTDLDVLEYHYDNHIYEFYYNSKLENYIMNELEEIIKLKKLKRDLNV